MADATPNGEGPAAEGRDAGAGDAGAGDAIAAGRITAPGRASRARTGGLAGAGLIAGAADVDPTTIGVLVAVAVASGTRMAWACLLVFPVLGVTQVIATRVGAATGTDLQTAAVRRHGRAWAGLLLVSVVAVNVFTIAADVDAGASALGSLLSVDSRWLVVLLALLLGGVLVASSFRALHTILVGLLAALAAAVAVLAALHPHWATVAHDSLVPGFAPGGGALVALTALFGTAVTSYVYVWQTMDASREGAGPRQLRRSQARAIGGAAVTAVLMWAFVVAAGPLHGRVSAAATGSAGGAARAFDRVVGSAAGDVFSAGLVVSSILALLVLASTTATVLGAELPWGGGSLRRIGTAPRVAAALGLAAVLGALLVALDVGAVPALVDASIAGALGAPVSLVFLVRLARDPAVMGGHVVPRWLAAAGGAVVVLAVGLAVAYLAHGGGGLGG